MPVDTVKVPQLFFLGATDAGDTKDMLAVFGSVYITNAETTNSVWINFTAAPPGAAADADGRIRLLAGHSMNLDDVAVQFVSAICSAGQTAALQIVAVKRPGSNSGGGA